MGFDQREYQALILAALLHDIGKISQREYGEYYVKHAEFSENFISSLKNFFGVGFMKEIANLIERHHQTPFTRGERIIHIADKLSAAERFQEERRHFKSNEAALLSVKSRIKFRSECNEEKYYKLNSLSVERDVLFPIDEPRVEEGAYKKTWNRFVEKIKSLGEYQPADFKTMYFILKEVGSFVPSATPWENDEYNRTVPDVSLSDHSKVTCAITACLRQLDGNEFPDGKMSELIETLRKHYEENGSVKKKEILDSSELVQKQFFVLLRADIAGIQKFIYTITKPKLETKGTSKRLRGRSFYVSLLGDVISDWIIRKIHLPITNILFCGGGRFDILLPNSKGTHEKLRELRVELDSWLLEEFRGELSVQIAIVEVAPKDFFDFNQVYRNVEDKLIEAKKRKFEGMIQRAEFFKSSEHAGDFCKSCLIVPVTKDGICNHCNIQRDIGAFLPKKNFISFVYDKYEGSAGISIPFEKLGVTVLLQDKVEMRQLMEEEIKAEICIYRINPEYTEEEGLVFLQENREKKPVSFGFKFLGNSVPIGPDGDVLEFDEIAKLSTGAKYLGILKMDIDYLGMLFALGIDSPTISRIATLSSNFEIFFGAWLNKICERMGNNFYTVYSGGDDLFIIGPWDQIIDLASEIYNDFREYTCQNPNITLSGGILFVKPHFPIHRFARLVTEELEKSKSDADKQKSEGLKEKNRITLFGETVEWRNGSKSFEELLRFAKDLGEKIEKEKTLTKGFIYFLGRLEEQFYKKGKMWVPYFLYNLVRRVKNDGARGELISKVHDGILGKMKIPVSYVSLKTRKEG